jgi:chromosome partitioning protein
LLTINALVAADAVLIPVKTDYLSIMGIPLTFPMLDFSKHSCTFPANTP